MLALKQYELSNHLDNVLATVLDRKTMTSDKVLAYATNFTGTLDGWTAGWSAAGTIYSATPPTTIALDNNRVKCTSTVSMGGVRKVINTTIGTAYTITMDIDMGTSEGLYIMPRATNGANEFTGTNITQVYIGASGTYTVNFTANTSTTQLLVEKAGYVEKYFFIDNVKVEQSTPTLSSYFVADVVGAQYYYPYHSTMKSFTAGENLDYPFGGANGQEKDNEIFNGAYGALFWEYDSRLGGNGRWNVDPKAHPGISPYATYVGNPIMFLDILGDSVGADFKEDEYSGKAFKAFLGTKEGYSYLSKFAAKGQTLYGVTFREDGEFHKKGIDLNFSNFSFSQEDVLSGAVYNMPRGETFEDFANGRLKLNIKLNYFLNKDKMTNEFQKDYNDAVKSRNVKKMDNVLLMSRVQTLTHETFIHVNQAVMRKLNIPFKEYKANGYGTDHYTEYMNDYYRTNTLWNTQGFGLLKGLNQKYNTGWNNDRINNSMWDFQY